MKDLRTTIREIIDRKGVSFVPIDVYAVAEALRPTYPNKSTMEIAKIVEDVAINETGNTVEWPHRFDP